MRHGHAVVVVNSYIRFSKLPVNEACKNHLSTAFCTMTMSFGIKQTENQWEQLFNKKDLSGWDTYIGPDLNDSGKPINGQPIGLNNDPGMFLPL